MRTDAKVDEGSVHPCIISSHRLWRTLLYSLGVMGWLMLVSIPGGLFAFVGWLIFRLSIVAAGEIGLLQEFLLPIPPPTVTAS